MYVNARPPAIDFRLAVAAFVTDSKYIHPPTLPYNYKQQPHGFKHKVKKLPFGVDSTGTRSIPEVSVHQLY